MKKLIMVMMAVVFAASFVPSTEAGETAQLGLQVTFAASEPLVIWSEPEGPFKVEAGKTLEFIVVAEDKDAVNVELKPFSLPEGAEWIVDSTRPVRNGRRTGTFRWTPKADSNANEYGYVAVFGASNGEEKVELKVEIRVINSIISIELNEPYWKLEGVKLGERRSNLNELGVPIHMVRNTGNVVIGVGIGYGSIGNRYIHPGIEQGVDTFVTLLRDHALLPEPDRLSPITKDLQPGKAEGIRLTYGAPTGLSQPTEGMSATYELRAFKAIVLDPIAEQ